MRTVIISILVFATYINAQNNRANLENKFRLAKSYERAGELEKAESILKQLVDEQAWNQRYVKALNEVYLAQKKYDLSIELLSNAIQINARDINFYGMLGTTYFIMNDKAKAYEIWDSAIEAIPNRQISYKLISNYAVENRDFEKAIEYLKAGKEVAENPQTYSHDLARIYIANMKYKNAVKEYCDILAIQPLQLEPIKRNLASFITRPGAADEVEEAISEYLQDSDNRTVKELLAYVYVTDNEHTKAYNLIRDIDIESGSDGVVLYKFAQELYNESEFETALNSFKSIIDNYSNSKFYASAKIGYARSFEELTYKKYEQINEDWKPFTSPDSSIKNLFEPVINTYDQLIDQFRDSQIAAESYLRSAIIMFEKQLKVSEAEEYLQVLLSQTQYSNQFKGAYFLLARIKVYTNQLDEAYQYFQKALLSRGVNEQKKRSIKLEQAKIKFWENQFSEAANLLADVSKFLQDDIANDALELSLLINTNKNDSLSLSAYSNALLLAEQDKFDEAYIIFDKLSGNQSAFMLAKFAEFKKAEMMIAQNKYGTAIELLDKIFVEDKSGLYGDKSLFLKANIYQFAMNDNIKAYNSYQKILENYPNSLYFDKSRELIQLLNNVEEPTI